MGHSIKTSFETDGGPLTGSLILVVDDDEDIRTFLLALFADNGAGLCEAEDGDEAIEMALAKKPDLITLDLSMPGRDGLSTFDALRENPDTKDIPVCIVTGHPEFRRVIYERSATAPDGFVAKPIDADELVRTARRILALRRRSRVRRS